MKFLPLSLILCLVVVPLMGCSKSDKGQLVPADTLAKDDPNAKAAQLLNEFDAQEAGEREAWVRNNAFAWSVFEKVTDAGLKAKFEQSVKPLLNQ